MIREAVAIARRGDAVGEPVAIVVELDLGVRDRSLAGDDA
jgi:hypothetical protein